MVYRTNIMNNKKLQNGEKFEKQAKKFSKLTIMYHFDTSDPSGEGGRL